MSAETPQDSPPVPAQAAPQLSKIHAHEIAVAVRNTLKLGSSLAITWSVALIVKLQIPAHLGPIRQGYYAFAESFATLFFAALGLGIDTYIIKEVAVRPEHASDFVGGVLGLRALLSVVLLAAMAVTLWLTGRPMEVQYAVAVFGLTQLAMSVNTTIATVLQATSMVGRLAIANVLGKILWGAGLLLALHYNAPLYVLALSMLASETLRTTFLVPAAMRAAKLAYRIDVAAVRKVVVASFPYFVNTVALGMGTYLSMSELEFLRTDEREVGWFAASQNLGALAMLAHPLISWILMPMLSRARGRSHEEMMAILRRCIEGLLILITPASTLISCGADVFIHYAFGDKFLPAQLSLSILSLVFILFYLSIILSSAMIIDNKSWSLTLISVAAMAIMAICMVVFVPLGRVAVGTGGESAGAAIAVIANEIFVVIALLSRFRFEPMDRRNVGVLIKSSAIALCVLLLNRPLHGLGPARLLVDLAIFVVLALATRLVRPGEMLKAIRVVRAHRAERATA
jgi:O-antigen/teichoic acid export membrane protein